MHSYGDDHNPMLRILLIAPFAAAVVMLGMYLIPTISTIMATLTSF